MFVAHTDVEGDWVSYAGKGYSMGSTCMVALTPAFRVSHPDLMWCQDHTIIVAEVGWYVCFIQIHAANYFQLSHKFNGTQYLLSFDVIL